MKGFAKSSAAYPDRQLPEKIRDGLKVCLKMTGGVGDALIMIGGSALALSEAGAVVTACVPDYQIPLMESLHGVSGAFSARVIHQPEHYGKFDVIVDFAGVLANKRELRAGDYYSLTSARVGREVGPGRFTFAHNPLPKPTVAIHAAASNPNRRWSTARWRVLAWELMDRGFDVLWLGTPDEFGFNSANSQVLHEISPDLKWQAEALARCTYFVGNDSGFCHIAGILGIPGVVLFSATKAADVIARYPLLKGVEVFDRLGIEPSRSLRPDDKSALRVLANISVEDVLAVADLPAPTERKKRVERMSEKLKLAVVGRTIHSDGLSAFLGQFYEVTLLDNVPDGGTEYAALLITDPVDHRVKVRTRDCEVTVDVHNPENVRRALREVIHR